MEGTRRHAEVRVAHDLDGAEAFEAGERGVQRAERDVGDEPELVAEEPADLVAVAVLLTEQAEDRESSTPNYSSPIYRAANDDAPARSGPATTPRAHR